MDMWQAKEQRGPAIKMKVFKCFCQLYEMVSAIH